MCDCFFFFVSVIPFLFLGECEFQHQRSWIYSKMEITNECESRYRFDWLLAQRRETFGNRKRTWFGKVHQEKSKKKIKLRILQEKRTTNIHIYKPSNARFKYRRNTLSNVKEDPVSTYYTKIEKKTTLNHDWLKYLAF